MSTFGEVIASLGGPATHPLSLDGVSSASNPRPGTVTFLRTWSEDARALVEDHPQTLFLVPMDAPEDLAPDRVARVTVPRLTYAQVVRAHLIPHPPTGISPRADVAESAQIGAGVSIGPFAVVEAEVSIGADTRVESHAVLKSGVTIGARCLVGAHTVIGTESFGYEVDESGHPIRVPHLGGVRIADDVEIGNHVTVGQGTIDPTVVANHVKIGDNVVIAHNSHIDEASFIISGAHLGGSVRIGKRVWVSPEVSIINKARVGDDALLALGTVVVDDVPPSAVVMGVPGRVVRPRHPGGRAQRPAATRESSTKD